MQLNIKKTNNPIQKWAENLNIRPETIQVLEENICRTSFDINHNSIFWTCLLRQKKSIKLKSFCTANETTDKTKRQPSEWEKIFVNDMTDKRLISKIYKHIIHLNINKTKHLNQKMGRRPE